MYLVFVLLNKNAIQLFLCLFVYDVAFCSLLGIVSRCNLVNKFSGIHTCHMKHLLKLALFVVTIATAGIVWDWMAQWGWEFVLCVKHCLLLFYVSISFHVSWYQHELFSPLSSYQIHTHIRVWTWHSKREDLLLMLKVSIDGVTVIVIMSYVEGPLFHP